MSQPHEKPTAGETRASIDRLLRVRQVLELIPISRSEWYRQVANGKAPKPLQLGPRTTVWRESEIRAYIENLKPKAA